MSRSINVAAMQLRARDRDDSAGSLDSTLTGVRHAATHADLVVLPEATFPAYVLGEAPVDETAVNDVLERLSAIARKERCVIVTGAAAPAGAMAYNSAFVLDTDGSLAGRVDKVFLWHFDRRWFLPGQRLVPVQTSIAKLGVLICADGRLPTIARELVDLDAEILVMPTAWVTSGRDPSALENVQADLLARVRAFENRVPFVAANKCGTEGGMVAYCGKSQIANRHGELIAIASEDREETIHAAVDLRTDHTVRPALKKLTARNFSRHVPVRIGISFEPVPRDIAQRLTILEDEFALSMGNSGALARLDATIPAAAVQDDCVLDPAGLVAYRQAGYRLICWTTEVSPPWAQRIARARALELRLYLVVFDRPAGRAFAVDPDGAVVAGTFGQYRLASFVFDPRRADQTTVAPSTDILEGLRRVMTIAAGQEIAEQ